MNSLVYRLTYLLGMSPWDNDRVPPELEQAFQQGNIPAGPALDLGCGTGTCAIYLARQGRQAIGIDFVPQAIARARVKARAAGVAELTQFIRADVTRLAELELMPCAFALDMGCFHGLSPQGQCKYAQALAGVLMPGGRYLLYVLDPRKEVGMTYGMQADQVRAVFAPWFDIEDMQPGAFWGRNSTWFWMRRKKEGEAGD